MKPECELIFPRSLIVTLHEPLYFFHSGKTTTPALALRAVDPGKRHQADFSRMAKWSKAELAILEKFVSRFREQQPGVYCLHG